MLCIRADDHLSVGRAHNSTPMPTPFYAPYNDQTACPIDLFCEDVKTTTATFAPAKVLKEEEPFRSIVATDKGGATLKGAATMVKLSDAKGYVCFLKTSQDMLNCHVQVENGDADACLKVISTKPAVPKRFHGNYVALHDGLLNCTLHARMFETLSTNIFGLIGMDCVKNMTIDTEDDDLERIAMLRDDCGFLISDRVKFALLEISLAALKSALEKNKSTVRVRKMDFGDSALKTALEDYDQSIAGYERMEYTQSLVKLLNASSHVCTDKDGHVKGWTFFNKSNIFGLYAQDDQVAHALFQSVCGELEKAGTDTVTLCSIRDKGLHDWLEKNARNALRVVRIYRRLNSRCATYTKKWMDAYAVNVGWQLI